MTHPPDVRSGRDSQAGTIRLRSLCVLAFLFAASAPVCAQRAAGPKLTELSLEELMQVEVTTVSKHAEKLAGAPAAVFALTQDDLRRSGAPNLPEALRFAPGVQVARVGAHDWALSARGFMDVFANKLLVLRDGRSLYTPLFSGVFWDVQDTMLEDIERVEIVRGPGATLWGANAVNGVINILSKPARDTQGLLTSLTAGTDPAVSGAVRYGGTADAATHYRVFAKYTRSAPSELVGGGAAQDRVRLGFAGFRVDRASGDGLLTVQGEGYSGREQQVFIVPVRTFPFVASLPDDMRLGGGHVLTRWTRAAPAGGELMAQAYFDYTSRKTRVFDDRRRIFDLELQQRLALGAHQLTLGAGYRGMWDRARNTDSIALLPPSARTNLWSAFVQDDIALAPKRWHLVLGTKLEHNAFTGVEVQPGVRLLWMPNEQHTAWASVARAVRTPSRADDDILLREVTATPGVSVDVRGDRRVGSEELLAWEAGHRFRLREKISVDVAVFYNDYRRLRTTEVEAASLPLVARLLDPTQLSLLAPPIVIGLRSSDLMRGKTHGGEIALNAQLARSWRLRTTFSVLRMNLRLDPRSTDTSAPIRARRNPRHQAMLWSQHDLGPGWKFDWTLRFNDRLPDVGIGAVFEADARLAWRPADAWEISLVGQNLLSPHHREFIPTSVITPAAEVSRRGAIEIRHGF